MPDAEGVEPREEVEGVGEDLAAEVDGPVHVQGDMPELPQPFRLRGRQRLIIIGGHIRFFYKYTFLKGFYVFEGYFYTANQTLRLKKL